jgi:aminoglycoside 6'-N-acetyltransferase I
MAIEIKVLQKGDAALLARVVPGVFDHPLDAHLTAEFLADPRHHLAVAIEDGAVIAMASAVHYVHPDKSPELWINEVGVAASHRGRGLGSAVLSAVLQAGQAVGCVEAWMLTHRSNTPAMRLYSSAGGTEAPEDQVMFTFHLGPTVPSSAAASAQKA